MPQPPQNLPATSAPQFGQGIGPAAGAGAGGGIFVPQFVQNAVPGACGVRQLGQVTTATAARGAG